MRKLLQINTVINSGSTGRIAEEIGQLAMANGWKSYIAYGRNDNESQSKKIKIGNKFDLYWHLLITRLFDSHGFGSKSATKKMIKEIIKINPDIIHLHNLHGYYLNIEILFNYLIKANIPVVWTLHDCWSITGHCVYFDFVGCEKWKYQCNQCPQKATYPKSYLMDRSKKNYNLKKELFSSLSNLTLVPVSQWLAEIVKQSLLKDYPIKTIHNGINTEFFKPSSIKTLRIKYNLEDKYIVLGVASGWSLRKGMKDFIELNKRLNSEFQIILVGLTKKQINTLPKNIIGIEKTETITELVEFYSESDVFLNLTYEDNFPTTNIEAMACGTPVITYKTGGSPESITKETGIVVEKGDIDAVIKAITTIKGNGKSYYSNFCRQRAEQFYNKDNKFKEYLKLYNEILNGQ